MAMLRSEKADRSANQSATSKITQYHYNTEISEVKEDYMISVPISAYTEGIRALATLSDITAILAAEGMSYMDVDAIRAMLGLGKGK